MKLKIYHYPKCGTCRNAIKWLKEKGHTLEEVHIVEQPPTVAELKELVALSGLDLRKFFNVSGNVYREMGLKDRLPGRDEDARYELLASNGMLIKRPIVSDGKRVTVGFREEQYEEVWGHA